MYFKNSLTSLQKELRIIRDVRGFGLMIGTEMRFDILHILQTGLQRGVLALDAGRNVLRFLPPLCIQRRQVDSVMLVLREILEEEQLAKLPS